MADDSDFSIKLRAFQITPAFTGMFHETDDGETDSVLGTQLTVNGPSVFGTTDHVFLAGSPYAFGGFDVSALTGDARGLVGGGLQGNLLIPGVPLLFGVNIGAGYTGGNQADNAMLRYNATIDVPFESTGDAILALGLGYQGQANFIPGEDTAVKEVVAENGFLLSFRAIVPYL